MTSRADRTRDALARWAARFAERRAEQVARNEARAVGAWPTPGEAAASGAKPGAGPGHGSGPASGTGSGSGVGEHSGPGDAAGSGGADAGGTGPRSPNVPAPPSYAPAVAARPDPASAVPWGVRVAAEAGWRLLVLAGVVFVLTQVIGTISLLIVAFSAGLLVTALLEPTAARLKRLGIGRGPATAATFVFGFVIMGLIGWFVVWQVMENLPTVTDRVSDGIDELKTWALNSPFHVSEKQINHIADTLTKWLGENSNEVTTAGLEGVTVLAEFLSGAVLTMFVTLFLLYDGRRIWEWVLKWVPGNAREGVAGAGPRAWATLTGYVRGTVIVALIDAICIGVGLYFLDVPMAVPLAVFIFLFAFIPIVGAVISGALAVLVALVTNGVFTALLVLLVVLAVQQLEGHILQPFILGRLVRVHPLGVVLSVTGGSLIAGIPGAVVAVPLVAVLNTTVGYLRSYAQEHALRSAAAASAGGEGEAAGEPSPDAGGGSGSAAGSNSGSPSGGTPSAAPSDVAEPGGQGQGEGQGGGESDGAADEDPKE